MGRDYTMTVHEAAEFVRDRGFDELQLGTEDTDVTYWRDLVSEMAGMLDIALKTEGQPHKVRPHKSRKESARVVVHEGKVIARWCPGCDPDNCHGCP